MEYLPLVGRQPELTTLMQELHHLESQQGNVVLIGAEAGGGKSALIRALERQSGAPISIGYCPGPGETAPYGPWLEALRNAAACRESSLDDLPTPFGRAGGEWTDRDCASALAAWVRAGNRPCVVALEDIHWADPKSLDLLRHLPHFLRDVPLLVVATYRHDEVHRKHPVWSLLPELHRAGAIRMPLSRLSVADVAQLVEAVFAQNPDGPGIAKRLHDRTSGHPFLVHELLITAMRTGSIPTEDDELPETALQMIDLKFAGVPDDTITLLQGAALLGERFSPELLGQVCDMPEESTVALLEIAQRHRIVHISSPEEAWFDHTLFRQALIRRLSVLQRRQLHQRIAEILLAQSQVDPEMVALHLSRANDSRAPDYLLRAGDRSVRMGALIQAADRYRRALELVKVDHPLRSELLLKLGFTMRLSDRELARTCWDEAAQLGTDQMVAAWARHFLALWHLDKGHPDAMAQSDAVMALHMPLLDAERYRQLEVDLFGAVSGYPRIVPNLVQLHAVGGNVSEARRLVDQIRPLATKESLHPQLMWAEIYVTMAEGRTAECCPMWEQLSEQYLQLRDYRQAAVASFNHLTFLVESMSDQPEAIDRAAGQTLRLEKLALERSGIGLVPAGYDSLGFYHFYRGNWDEARVQLLDYFREHPEDRRFLRRLAAFELHFAQGDYAGARETLTYLEPLRPDDPPVPNLYFSLFTHACQARLALAVGDRVTARTWLEAADRWDASGPSTFTPYIAMAWADYHRQAGDTEASLAAARRTVGSTAGGRHLTKQIEARRLIGELLAERGESSEAGEQFALAESMAERCHFPYLLALSQLSRVRSHPSSAKAGETLTAALETFRRLGAGPALAAATALQREWLLADGTSFHAGLSRREAEVALWVARGLTDKEVAAKLFISRRTVDTHLRHIFGKAGVSNRTALGTWVAEHRLDRHLNE